MNGTSINAIIPNYRITRQKSPCVIYARPGIDSKIKFSIEPLPGEEAFNQWRDAMKAVARLPLGIPAEFRKKVWLALAENHIDNLKVDWEQICRLAFNERSNPDDNRLGLQIVKDLHRTGCSGFSGSDNEEDRAILKRVLLAYARWNKKVGYCQGFNVLAALILKVMDRKEDDALKVMIYLVDHVLPESYFANNLQALSVDMAVFRDLLHIHLPQLSKHLDQLQAAARDDTTGANYEPPLTNVFTMQWFLTLFATCLPKPTALRVWDCIILEGSEILLRTAVAIWGKLQNRIMGVENADEFYTTMGTLTHEMLNCNIIEADDIVKKVYSMAPVPMPQLGELREKYTYNITPFSASMSTTQKPRSVFPDDDDFDEDEFVENINCFAGMFPPQMSPTRRGLGDLDRSQSSSSFDISKASPGAYGAQPEFIGPLASAYTERMSLDIHQLKKQYKKLRQRQNQAHVILAAASALHYKGRGSTRSKASHKPQQPAVPAPIVAPIQSPMAVNHLFIGRQQVANGKRNKTIAVAPHIAPIYTKHSRGQKRPTKAQANLEQYRVMKAVGMKGSDGSNSSDDVNSRFSRSMSVDSLSSAHSSSTLKSSHPSGSVSDVSTCGAESDCILADGALTSCENMRPDLMCWGEEEEEEGSSDTHTEVTDSDQKETQDIVRNKGVSPAEQVPNEEKGQLNVSNESKPVTTKESDSSEQESSSEHCDDKQNLSDTEEKSGKEEKTLTEEKPLPNNCQNEASTLSSNQNEESSTNEECSDINCELVLPENSPKHISQGTKLTESRKKRHASGGKMTVLQSVQVSSGEETLLVAPREMQHRILSNGKAPEKPCELYTDPETHYVASLTYKSHKLLQPQNDPISMVTSSSHHSIIPANQTTALNSASLRAPKVFNPFPGQHFNSRRLKNGVKLGLYSASDMPKLEATVAKCQGTQEVSRSQHGANPGLHRQYMSEIKQHAKSNKR